MEKKLEQQEISLKEIFPAVKSEEQTFFLLPDRIDLMMEDGTIYHVSSFFTGKEQMTTMLDALNLEKIDRTA